jgi:hypothetical protein
MCFPYRATLVITAVTRFVRSNLGIRPQPGRFRIGLPTTIDLVT